jgi:hypothetical protein
MPSDSNAEQITPNVGNAVHKTTLIASALLVCVACSQGLRPVPQNVLDAALRKRHGVGDTTCVFTSIGNQMSMDDKHIRVDYAATCVTTFKFVEPVTRSISGTFVFRYARATSFFDSQTWTLLSPDT